MSGIVGCIDVSSFHKGELLNIGGSMDIMVPGSCMVSGDNVKTVYDGELSFDGECFALSLSVNAVFGTPCARCLKETETEFQFSVSESYEKAALIENKLDLAETLRAGILSEMPVKVLCREDCKGLCPYCGCDRNEADCGCVKPVDSIFAEIKAQLKEV